MKTLSHIRHDVHSWHARRESAATACQCDVFIPKWHKANYFENTCKFFSLNVSMLGLTLIEQVFVMRGLVDHKFPSSKNSSLVVTRFIVTDAFEKAASFLSGYVFRWLLRNYGTWVGYDKWHYWVRNLNFIILCIQCLA